MNTTKEVAAKAALSRRHLLIGGAAVVVVAAGGAGYYFWSRPGPVAPPVGSGDVSMAELMLPGPLGDQALGAANAPVTIVEYASMTCPHCANFHETIYPELKKKYVDTGKVRFIFREFPLDPLAAAGSMLARCAGKDKFFPLIETLFAQQKDWVVQKPLEPMFAIVRQAGFTQQTFDQCLEESANPPRHRGIAEPGGEQVQRHVHAHLLHQRQDLPRLPDAGGGGQAGRRLSQGLIRVFCLWQGAPGRPPLAPGAIASSVRGGTTSSFCCGITRVDSFSRAMRHTTSTHPLGASPEQFRQGRPTIIGTAPA